MRLFLLNIAIILLLSCNNRINLDSIEIIQPIDEFSLRLDSNSGFFSYSIFYLKEKDEVSLYNSFIQTIDFYDCETGELSKRVPIKEVGTYVSNSMFEYYHYIVGDTILIYETTNNVLSFIDNEGNLIGQKVINYKKKDELTSVPDPQTNSPIAIMDDWIVIPSNLYINVIEDHSTLNIFLAQPRHNGSNRWIFNRVKEYNNGSWGINAGLFKTYNTYNFATKQVYYSPPISDSVYIISLDNRYKAIQMKSHLIDKVKPLYKNKVSSTGIESTKYEYSTSHYHNIIYNDLTGDVHRFTYIGNSEKDFISDKENLFNGRIETIITANQDFVIKSEKRLPLKEYYTPMYFMRKGKLYIANRKQYLSNNDSLTFGVFEL